MAYKIKNLPSFKQSAFEADADLYALSPNAADQFYVDYNKKIENLRQYPIMYPIFDDEPYFRSAALVYGYRLFYHADEPNKTVVLHRVLHGSMNLIKHLQHLLLIAFPLFYAYFKIRTETKT
jgi:plasmid stabilization system protein ParE